MTFWFGVRPLGLMFIGSAGLAQTFPADRLAAADRLIAVVETEKSLAQAATPPKFDMADCMDSAVDHPGGLDCEKITKEREQATAAIQAKGPQILAKVRAAMRVSYARRFETDELDSIAAFYRTSAGRHLLRERPALEADIHAVQNRAFAEAVFGASLSQEDARPEVSPQ